MLWTKKPGAESDAPATTSAGSKTGDSRIETVTDTATSPSATETEAATAAAPTSAASKARERAVAARLAAEAAESEAEAAEARDRAAAARLAALHAEEEAREAEAEVDNGADDEADDVAVTPEPTAAEVPETETLETPAPASQAPETQALETQAPEAQALEAQAPESGTASRRSRFRRGSTNKDGTPRRPRSKKAVAGVAVAVLLIAGFLGVSGYMISDHHDVTTQQSRNVAFAQAARQGVVNMTTLDFNNAQADVQRVIDGSTGGFRDDFQGRSDAFIQVVEQSQVVTEGTVSDAGVESTDGDSAVVLVAATSKVTNAAGAEQEPRSWRLRVTVSPDGDQLKMSKVEFVP